MKTIRVKLLFPLQNGAQAVGIVYSKVELLIRKVAGLEDSAHPIAENREQIRLAIGGLGLLIGGP